MHTATIGVFSSSFYLLIQDREQVSELGFFHGYSAHVWVVIVLQAFGGILVALVIKFADNILKGFATSTSILLTSLVSMYFLGSPLSSLFAIGAVLVILAVFMYASDLPMTVLCSSRALPAIIQALSGKSDEGEDESKQKSLTQTTEEDDDEENDIEMTMAGDQEERKPLLTG